MINLTFEIENQLLKRTDKLTIVRNSRNIIKSSFTFDTEIWEDINKFVIFTDSWGEQSVTHLGKVNKCSCIIPSSCLKGTHFKVSVYGGDLITTNDVTIILQDSSYKHHHHRPQSGHCEHSHDKDIFVDIFDRLDTKIDGVLFADGCLQLYSNDELVDSVCFNYTVDDAQLIERITEIDSSIKNLESALDNKSDINHQHVKNDIDGLDDLLSISEFNQVILDELDE